ncbi:hypothetical protein BDY19DRAFT_264395 [Irpex rosettiformis]|uniref:Uncharacterized protein n=1 Tax=Irpex rosettiformis TaxID=378272 RepID=A0ACB8UH61_9APHY|nr:hypothetical protein BDY19DRAFT_264395 [Irpex rosettiformis]
MIICYLHGLPRFVVAPLFYRTRSVSHILSLTSRRFTLSGTVRPLDYHVRFTPTRLLFVFSPHSLLGRQLNLISRISGLDFQGKVEYPAVSRVCAPGRFTIRQTQPAHAFSNNVNLTGSCAYTYTAAIRNSVTVSFGICRSRPLVKHNNDSYIQRMYLTAAYSNKYIQRGSTDRFLTYRVCGKFSLDKIFNK